MSVPTAAPETRRTVYVAGCLERAGEARFIAGMARVRGWDVVSNWHEVVDRIDPRGIEARSGAAERQTIAEANIIRLRGAHAVLFLADARCRGSLVEVGHALGEGRPVFAIGRAKDHTLMLEAARWHSTVDDALADLARWAETGGA